MFVTSSGSEIYCAKCGCQVPCYLVKASNYPAGTLKEDTYYCELCAGSFAANCDIYPRTHDPIVRELSSIISQQLNIVLIKLGVYV